MRKFRESLDSELAHRAKKGEVVLVGEAVLTKNVPDITDTLRDAFYASGIARPRPSSAAELQRLQDQAMVAAGQAAPPPQAILPIAYPGTVAPGDIQHMPRTPEQQYVQTAPST